MDKVICAIYDSIAEEYGKPIEFENDNLAVASIRRDVRDLYFSGEISYDRMKDEQLVFLATYDSDTGYFECFDEEEREFWNVRYFVDYDELKDEDKEIENRVRWRIKENREKVLGEDEISD